MVKNEHLYVSGTNYKFFIYVILFKQGLERLGNVFKVTELISDGVWMPRFILL